MAGKAGKQGFRRGRTMNILVVDDNEPFASSLQQEFDGYGITTVIASGVEDAMNMIQLLSGEGIELNLILSDIDMPDGDGFDLFDRVQAQVNPAPKFIFMSAWVSAWKKQKAQHRKVEIFPKSQLPTITKIISVRARQIQ
jgi:CheY-like chemotaxis protein